MRSVLQPGGRVRLRAWALAAALVWWVAALPAVASAGQVLPTVPSALGPGASCTGASSQQAHAQPWTVRALSLDRAWRLTEGSGVTVAVVDTGVGTSIPALAGRVTAVGRAGTDCVGHGSFAAGLIGAAATSGAGVVGVAPEVRILAVAGTNRLGTATPALVADGIRTAVDHGAKVVYVGETLTAGRAELASAVAHATAHDALVVAPAAPDAAPAATTAGGADTTARAYYPASLPGVLSVEDYGSGGTRPTSAPGILHADLAAPGDAVVSVGPSGSGDCIGSGSSFAAANAAGAAALVRAYRPHLTAAQVRALLISTAFPGTVPVVDPYAAVSAVPGESARVPPAPEPAVVAAAPGAGPLHRALVIAGLGGLVVAVIAAVAALTPLGRARRWRPVGTRKD